MRSSHDQSVEYKLMANQKRKYFKLKYENKCLNWPWVLLLIICLSIRIRISQNINYMCIDIYRLKCYILYVM